MHSITIMQKVSRWLALAIIPFGKVDVVCISLSLVQQKMKTYYSGVCISFPENSTGARLNANVDLFLHTERDGSFCT